jgi:hypothetical protein
VEFEVQLWLSSISGHIHVCCLDVVGGRLEGSAQVFSFVGVRLKRVRISIRFINFIHLMLCTRQRSS